MSKTVGDGAPLVELAPTVAALHAGRRELTAWEWTTLAPDAAAEPSEIPLAASWRSASAPGTVATAMRALGAGEGACSDLDRHDHWYRCGLPTEAARAADRLLLCFDGLATVADVWLDGRHVLHSDNMFHSHVLDVTALAKPGSELTLCFRALAPRLGARHPRPRWKTRLVDSQNLRFFRTTLLGRMPGWSPPPAAVGPWRPVALVHQAHFSVCEAKLVPAVADSMDAGHVDIDLLVERLSPIALGSASVRVAGASSTLVLREEGDSYRCTGRVEVEGIQPWWPHTHGVPHRYPVHLSLTGAGVELEFSVGQVGFRRLEVDRGVDGRGFGLRVNGVRLFCRGACWTSLDTAGLIATDADYRSALEQARDGGMNMLRLGGTMFYEADAFYDVCDELGLLVWQDFMFANMDYPVDDEAFVASVEREARQLLARIGTRPCLAVVCGGSEVEQQSAMMGMPAELWSNRLFREALPHVVEELAPSTTYVTSSPTGGALPFVVDEGVSHYFGVGAYLRPMADARLADPRFATECLAFSNLPEDRSLYALLSSGEAPVHHPRYKAGVPRDNGAGWDFADVTDHYLEQLFQVNARQLRYADMDRYLALARVTPGEVMAEAVGHWRRRASRCHGALVWFYRDLHAGAGWGVVDSGGVPKAPYYYLKRAWAPVSLWLIDEGLNGLMAHIANDGTGVVRGRLEVAFHSDEGTTVQQVATEVEIAPASDQVVHIEALLGRFVDSTYAYRFGPSAYSAVGAHLFREGVAARIDAHYFPVGRALARRADLGLTATARHNDDGTYALDIHTDRFAQAVSVDARGYLPTDNYFHLSPGHTHTVELRSLGEARKLSGRVSALNGSAPVRIATS